MTYPVQETIYQGETLLLELRFVGEDLTDAQARVEVSPGLSGNEFSVSKEGVDTVIVRCAQTAFFPVGRHEVEVWLDWPPSTPVRDELAVLVYVTVSRARGAA